MAASEHTDSLPRPVRHRVRRVPAPTLYIYPAASGEMAGQILDAAGRPIAGIGGCEDRNAVIDAATEAGYHDLRITDVPRLEDVLGFGPGRSRNDNLPPHQRRTTSCPEGSAMEATT